MWIRSQDKKRLIDAEMIEICDNRIFVSELPSEMITSGICVGKYGSEERAVEVLDGIQNALDTYINDKNFNLALTNAPDTATSLYPIFQMPEK
ncbi:hypothetical protein [Clostridium sp. BJN0013]|jgi:hypothetical protein|uniref:hypothetical protein n=1 Tax=Clostridium sp. BJN0013 TaxID=3236840 RepID=UPI0034C6376A